jgi:hypothetical protein
MANAFNSVSKGVIFQKLHVAGGNITQLILFVCAFYAFKSPLFYNHHNYEGDVTSSLLPREPITVILWEGHYSH